MSNNILTNFQQQEAETTAAKIQFNRWSQALIEQMIWEHEEKMMASDLPVDEEEVDALVVEIAPPETDSSEGDNDGQRAPAQQPAAGVDEPAIRKQEEETAAGDLPADEEEVEVPAADVASRETDNSG